MCIARVGRVVSLEGQMAMVEFFDGKELGGVDISMVGAEVGSHVEVYGNLALSRIPESEVRGRKRAWAEVRRAAAMPSRRARER